WPNQKNVPPPIPWGWGVRTFDTIPFSVTPLTPSADARARVAPHASRAGYRICKGIDHLFAGLRQGGRPMPRFLRILLKVVAALVILAVGLLIAGRIFLTSDIARRHVASHLEEVYGGPVEVEGADIGLFGGSSLRGLRLYEPGRPEDAPWASAGSVRADVSALDLLRGVTPK